MTIAEAAAKVLREHDAPMTVEEILATITAQQLFQFKTSQPRQVLRAQLRRHCSNVESAASSDKKLFVVIAPDRYRLA